MLLLKKSLFTTSNRCLELSPYTHIAWIAIFNIYIVNIDIFNILNIYSLYFEIINDTSLPFSRQSQAFSIHSYKTIAVYILDLLNPTQKNVRAAVTLLLNKQLHCYFYQLLTHFQKGRESSSCIQIHFHRITNCHNPKFSKN